MTPNAGMAAVTELLERLAVVRSLDAATGSIKFAQWFGYGVVRGEQHRGGGNGER